MAAKRIALVVNPRSGGGLGQAALDEVKPVLTAAGIEPAIHLTQRPRHARHLAESLDLAECQALGLVGGDGTVHEVVNGLMRRAEPPPVPLAIIPAGTGNTLSEHLGCGDPVEAARRILAGRTAPLDVLRVATSGEVVYCVDHLGWGASADINRTAERLRRLGRLRYALATLWQLRRPRARPARVVLDGRGVAGEWLLAIACNPKFAGRGMLVAPRADLADGRFDLVVLRLASRLQLLRLFAKVYDGSYLALGHTEYHQVRSFAIVTPGHDALEMDGEMTGTTPLTAEVVPAALRIVVGPSAAAAA